MLGSKKPQDQGAVFVLPNPVAILGFAIERDAALAENHLYTSCSPSSGIS